MHSPADALFLKPCQFMLGCVSVEGLPAAGLPEVAFAGRSNVGKSSLINALVNNKNMAKASNTPGRTREVNFFNLADALRLVDLPGYGYAKAGRKEVNSWTRLVRAYLAGRATLQRVCLLIDARHGLKDSDHEIMNMLDEAAVSYQIVLTKTDKIKPGELAALMDATQKALKRHPAAHPAILPTSSEKKTGISELRAELAGFAVQIG